MLASIDHILPLTLIRRERFLSVSGRVLVRKGQQVSATEVVAEASLHPEHLLLDLARGLGLPEAKADQQIHYRPGDQVAEGDVLAGPVGLTQRVVRAPRNGKVILAGSGQILLEVDNPPYELEAGLPGMVIELIDDRGVVIETTGALIQGVWGNGQVDFGLMYVLAESPEDLFTVDRVDVSLRGSIIMAGHCADPEVIKAAGELPLRGMILASIDPAVAPLAARATFPIIVLEGFGRIPMNPAAFKLLVTNERREVALNAQSWDRYAGNRPEVVIPLPAPGNTSQPVDTDVYAPGQQVRIVGAPHLGRLGKIIEVQLGYKELPVGLKTPAAEVQLEDGESFWAPLTNLEIIA
jgi:hypothetical protein